MKLVRYRGKNYVFLCSYFRTIKPNGLKEHCKWVALLASVDGKTLCNVQPPLSKVDVGDEFVVCMY
jgi:hypothetical protein